MASLKRFIPNSSLLFAKAADAAPTIPLESLAGKLVFFYFSASWCPPCRGFTPQLIEFYNKHHEAKKFEVILVSWDEEKEDHLGYFGKMPWLSLPFEDQAGIKRLNTGFSVESIPTLVGVNADTGDVVTTTARTRLVKDPEGAEFPWSS